MNSNLAFVSKYVTNSLYISIKSSTISPPPNKNFNKMLKSYKGERDFILL